MPITRLILKIQGSNFTCKPDLNRGINHIWASMSNYHFLDYILDLVILELILAMRHVQNSNVIASHSVAERLAS